MPIIALNASQLPSLFVNHGHLVSRLNDRQNYPNLFLMYNKTPARLGTGVFAALNAEAKLHHTAHASCWVCAGSGSVVIFWFRLVSHNCFCCQQQCCN